MTSGCACPSSEIVVVPELLQWLMGWLESEHAGVHEVCGNPVTLLSSLLMMTRPDL